jgi:hypothetical protein
MPTASPSGGGPSAPVPEIAIGHAELDDLRRLQAEMQWGWPAVFIANKQGEIWRSSKCGSTPVEGREFVRGLSELVDRVAREYLRIRPEGGRFFIMKDGASYRDGESDWVRFLSFRLVS